MNTGPAIPPRSMLVLGAAVLALHLWLLSSAPRRVTVRSPSPAFVTRSIPGSVSTAPSQDRAPAAAEDPLRGNKAPRGTPPKTPAPHSATAPSVHAPPRASSTVAAPPAQARRPSAAAPGLAVVRFSIPPSVRLHYEVTGKARHQLWQGRSELLWRHDGASYQARLEVSVPVLSTRVQHSTGSITAEGLAPLRFSDKARSEEAAHFERELGKVSFSSNRPDAPLLAGAQDRLSVLLQLGAMIAGEPSRFPAGTTLAIQTAGTREAEPWRFMVEAEEELALPGGSVGALKLSRNPRRDYEPRVELWLAPGMDYVPVRLRLTHPNGDWVDQQWASTDTR